MACGSATLNGIVNACETSMGGVKNVWLAPYEEGAATIGSDAVSALTTDGFKHYYFKKNTASMVSTLNIDAPNGVTYVTTELQMVFNRMETTKRLEIAAMSVYDTMAVVEDANGVYWFLGFDNPLNATAAEGNSGVQKTDGNKYSITLSDESNVWPYELKDDTAIAALKALIK